MNKELLTITDIVQDILNRYPETRNSDNRLYYKVLKVIGSQKGVDIETMSLPNYLLHMKEYKLPSIESVSRCRRKVVELHPELIGSKTVQDNRKANISRYKAYARGTR